MAEWPSTDLFHRAQAASRRLRYDADTSFRPSQAAFTEGSEKVNNRAEEQQRDKAETEQHLSSEQFPHEVELKNKDNPQRPPQTLLKLGLSTFHLDELILNPAPNRGDSAGRCHDPVPNRGHPAANGYDPVPDRTDDPIHD
jgi:hypothetical protein